MGGLAVPENVWNAIPSSYLSTSGIATFSTAGAIGRGGIGSEGVLTLESVVPGTSMVYGYGGASSGAITPPNYHNTHGQHYNHTTHLPFNHGLGSAYPINASTSSGYFGHLSDLMYPNTTPSDIYNDNDTGFFTNTGSGYSTPSTNTNPDDPTSFPNLNAIRPNGTPQNLYAGRFLPHAVTAPTSSAPSLACTEPHFNAPIHTLQYAHNDLQSQSRPNESPSSQNRRKPYACNIAGCRDRRFLTLQSRLTHARKMHKQSFPCSHPDCPRMEDYTDFGSRQSLDNHWLLEHQAAKHFRCSKCCYSTGNATHMRKGHLKMHYQKVRIFQVMEEIKKEKNDRNTSSEAR